MKSALEAIRARALERLQNAEDLTALEEARVQLLGKKGELTAILRESAGSPLGIAVTARSMSGGKPFSPEVAPFESFDLEMARMVSGNSHAGELLIRNAELHPGMGHYSEMEKYYRALPKAIR